MARTEIAWTEETWNPLAGCTEISPGCQNCYAAKMAKRLEAMGQAKYAGTTRTLDNGKVVWTGKITLDEDALHIPLKRRTPTMYFVNSMSDLFHEDVPGSFIDAVFAVMAMTPQHTYQVLTKRAERLPKYMAELQKAADEHAPKTATGRFSSAGVINLRMLAANVPGGIFGRAITPLPPWPLPNVWLGVSVEDQARAIERIPHLLKTPAAVRFLSCEPLLGPVRLVERFNDGATRDYLTGQFHGLQFKGENGHPDFVCSTEDQRLPKIDWAIAGGEGNGKRPCNLGWIRSIVEQCRAASVPCFVKQLGSNPIMDYYEGDPDWREWGLDHQRAIWQCSHGAYSEWSEREGQPPPKSILAIKLASRNGTEPEEWPDDLRVRQFPAVARATA